MNQTRNDLDLIVAELERKNPENGPAIPRESVLRWMEDPNIEVKGAVYALTSKDMHTRRIRPHLTFEMDKQFVLSYFAQCIAENPPLTSEFADSRFSACCNLVEWFRSLWNDTTIPRSAISDIKDWIRQQYLNGDTEIRRTLVQATLEHLFEDSAICEVFSDWQSQPLLADAYGQAKRWSERRTERQGSDG